MAEATGLVHCLSSLINVSTPSPQLPTMTDAADDRGRIHNDNGFHPLVGVHDLHVSTYGGQRSVPVEERGVEVVWDLMFGFVGSFAMRAAVLLGVPEILGREGPGAALSALEIAKRLPCEKPNVAALARILKYLAAKDMFNESGPEEELRYSLNAASRYLVGDEAGKSMAPLALFQVHPDMIDAFKSLNEVVLAKKSCSAFEIAKGKPIFAYAQQHPEFSKTVNNAMASSTKITMETVVKHYKGFKDLNSIVDVGGGLGTALSQIVLAYPHLMAINFDLPHVVADAPTIPGVQHVGGNMFESVPHADAIFVQNVFVDWDEESCIKILQNCHKALPEGGKVIIVEPILEPSGSKGLAERLAMDADLVLLTSTGEGRLRTHKQWKKRLEAAGFRPRVNIVSLPLPNASVIEAYIS
ncbi:hypothetical protein O6H91_07G103900 [Diphasiastrum complanatum]|uniref:Uncharacterized protein n=1 Tax=Diphasiastrum complanatum TaxID=34168 RepID=A0ACC2D958_DIPCM|nr:hypothetical protein O6H91_07G103900 [Diphasiastrum complanatum]